MGQSYQPLCSFQDKLYILSSEEAYQKFVTNPRKYLLPPMPRPPCKVAIIGPPQAGKSTLCKMLTQHYNALVLDMHELVQPVLAKVEQERLDKVKEENTRIAIEKIKMKMDDEQNSGMLSLVNIDSDYYIIWRIIYISVCLNYYSDALIHQIIKMLWKVRS